MAFYMYTMSFLFLNYSLFSCLLYKERKKGVWNCRGGGSREDLGGVGEGNLVINIFLNCLQFKEKQNKTNEKELIHFYT